MVVDSQRSGTTSSDGSKAYRWQPVDDKLMKSTARTCLDALCLLTDIYLSEWEYLSGIPTSQKAGQPCRKREAEKLVIRGFFDTILNLVTYSPIRGKLQNKIDSKMLQGE